MINQLSGKLGLGIGLIFGVAISAVIYATAFAPGHEMQSSKVSAASDDPLYWVAPMDPNFKRDKPGKSPMGMDLVPVYANDAGQDAPGTVSIDPVTLQNLAVKTQNVELIQPVASLETVGQVKYAQDAIKHIHPRVEGWIESLVPRTPGDHVRKGEPLYALYSPELVNAQEEFVLALQQTNATLIKAAKQRLQALSVPDSVVQDLEKTRAVSQAIIFNAPQSGFIDELNVQEGFFVKPSMTMMSIAPLDTVWVIAEVFPSDAGKLQTGQIATITTDDQPGHRYEAELSYLYPSLSSETRTVRARFVVTNSQEAGHQPLKPNSYARVTIQTGDQNNSIIAVPSQAVIRTGTMDRVVLVESEGKFKSIAVKLGQSYDDYIEVVDGLTQKDEVVTSAQFLIDSESSINSDLKRLTPENPEPDDRSAWARATVNEVLADRNMVNVTHGPLDTFQMMGMTMNFNLADDLEVSDFQVGSEIEIEVIREASGMFQIRSVKSENHAHETEMRHSRMGGESKEPEPQAAPSARTEATVNAVDADRRRVNLSHGYLDAFKMMGMTMDFLIAEQLDINDFEIGSKIEVEIIRHPSGMFQVNRVHGSEQGEAKPHIHHDHGGHRR